ncbi:MAG: hypothetical protein KBS81_08150, partial [Spirochaetales bacterium]|nr:hypothetical protein [Candidatus Physcosoma equi]
MQTKRRILVALHLFLFLSSLIITIYGVVFGFGVGQRGSMLHFGYFKTFTIDSNVFCGLVSLFVACALMKNKKDLSLPHSLVLLQYAAAVSVGLTVLIVVTFLAPMGVLAGGSYFTSFAGTTFFFHFFNPILSGALFVYGSVEEGMGRKENFLGTLPMILYAVYYIMTAVILETM